MSSVDASGTPVVAGNAVATPVPGTASPAPTLLQLQIGGQGSTPYKSIDSLSWNDIPPLAILTGVNGSGKSQLLELLAYKLTGTNHPQGLSVATTTVTVTGESFGPDSVVYIPASEDIGGAPSIGLAEMRNMKAQLHQQLSQEHQIHNNIHMRRKRARLEQYLGLSLNAISQADFVKRLPDDFEFMVEEVDVIGGLSHIFVGYRLQMLELLEQQVPADQIPVLIGTPPWEVVNEVLRVAEFQYSVVSPIETKLLDHYNFRLRDRQTGLDLSTQDLSSGEKAILRLILWLYNSQNHKRFPKLLMLDEPDAHLHPSMTRQFLSVISEVLVERYGVRVILATHSPSTVALAPEGSVFEMSRTQPRIVKATSNAHSVGLLTAGLVTVSRGSRFVFVEDEDDVEFYRVIHDVLTDSGPSKDRMAIDSIPSVVFLAASIKGGSKPQSGGKDSVIRWVGKLDQSPLDEIFRGVIDLDAGNIAPPRVFVIGRYSIENYLLDPIVVFGLLLSFGIEPKVAGLNISSGDEHQLRSMPAAKLQLIVDEVHRIVAPTLSNVTPADSVLRDVAFTTGMVLQYPAWMLDRQGHGLFPVYQAAFGGPKVVSPPALRKMWRRVRVVPVELANLLRVLQH